MRLKTGIFFSAHAAAAAPKKLRQLITGIESAGSNEETLRPSLRKANMNA